jgi:fatty acid desaturase
MTAPPTARHAERIGSLQQELTAALGEGTVAALHRESLPLDLAGTFVPPAALLLGFWLLGRPDLGWPATLALVAVNGWLFTIVGLVAHDVCVHRVRWGRRLSWLHAALAMGMLTVPGTGYARAHIRHHARLGTPEDTEAYKMGLDAPLKRWFFATLPGFLVATRAPQDGQPGGYLSVPDADAATRRRLAAERAIVIGALGFFTLYALLVDARQALLGYLVPLLVVSPLLNSVRIVLEHAEADDSSRYWLGTNYRCGWLTRTLFLADSGDCHIVHHIFPRIPFYHCPRAARLIRPYVAERGARERQSFWWLMRGWFVTGHRHRSVWPAR